MDMEGINARQRARVEYAHTTLDTARERLLCPAVQQALGRVANQLCMIADAIVVVESQYSKDGDMTYTLDEYQRTEQIPLIAVSPGDTFYNAMTVQTPLQARATSHALSEYRRLFHDAATVTDVGSNLVQYPDHVAAVITQQQAVTLGATGHTLLVDQRPLIALNYDRRDAIDEAASTYLIHELSHVNDSIRHPVHDTCSDYDFASELRAYAVESVINQVTGVYDAQVTAIERMRERYNGPLDFDTPTSFMPDPALKAELRAQGVIL